MLGETHLRARPCARRLPGTGSGGDGEGRRSFGSGPASTQGGWRNFQPWLNFRGRICLLRPALFFLPFAAGWLKSCSERAYGPLLAGKQAKPRADRAANGGSRSDHFKRVR